jgi:hypothetical protein
MGPLHEDVHVISREKLLGGVSPGCSGYFVLVSWITPAWGIPNQPHNHVIQFSVMTSSPGRHEPVIPPMRRSLTPDNSDVFGTFLKDQKLNSCKHAIISQLFLIFFLLWKRYTCLWYTEGEMLYFRYVEAFWKGSPYKIAVKSCILLHSYMSCIVLREGFSINSCIPPHFLARVMVVAPTGLWPELMEMWEV